MSAYANLDVLHAYEIPVGTAIVANRFIGPKSGALSQDLDDAEDQASVLGSVITGVVSHVEQSGATKGSGRDRSIQVCCTPGAIVRLEVADTVISGRHVTSDGDGRAVPVGAGKRPLAIALEDGFEAGKYISALLI